MESAIVGNIVERKNDKKKENATCNVDFPDKSTAGFPSVFKLKKEESGNQKRSLFWQNAQKSKATGATPQDESKMDDSATREDVNYKIGMENDALLQGMSREEILQEKRLLEERLDPSLIAFIKSRKRKEDDRGKMNKSKIETEIKERINEEISNKRAKEENDEKMECEEASQDSQLPEPAKEILQEAEDKNYVHMDHLEIDKLKWMGNVPEPKEPSKDEPYNARFDFQGVLLPFNDEKLTMDKGLHHHGEEPERPGYSLQELLQLTRSSSQQQRCSALATIANILEKTQKGWYDDVLQPSPLVALSERNVMLLLRFSIDQNSPSLVTTALQALRSFLCCEEDEICLDRSFGWGEYREPSLEPPPTDVKDTSELKDHELAQLDAISALLRTDVLSRIKFVLMELRPPIAGVTAAMEILTRIARHSRPSAIKISETPSLLETIVENFMPLNVDLKIAKSGSAYGVPMSSAVKFLRVLLYYAGTPAADKLQNLNIVPRLISYMSCDAGNEFLETTIESLRLWKLLLRYGVSSDSISAVQMTLVSQLRLIRDNYSLSSASEFACEHAAALIALCHEDQQLRTVEVNPLLPKWKRQLLEHSNPSWGNMKVIVETILCADDSSRCQFIADSCFANEKLLENLCSSSNLLSNMKLATSRTPSSLPGLSAVTKADQLQPVLSKNSPIPFLASVFEIHLKSQCQTNLKVILDKPAFKIYMSRLSTNDWSLLSSWYTRHELRLISALLKILKTFGPFDDTAKNVAFKLIISLPFDFVNDVYELLDAILDEHDLNMIFDNFCLKNTNYSTPKLADLYKKYLSSDGRWDTAIMPADWIYLPLIEVYDECRRKPDNSEWDTIKITATLHLDLNLKPPEISPTLKFSRLSLVYLCGTVYHEKKISELIVLAVKRVLQKQYKKLDFSEELPGLGSFVDLYTALCENFCSNSYGHNGFAEVILVPTTQRHDAHFRKILWSEHAAALRYIRIKPENLSVPVKEFFYPLEEDSSLIESYLTALMRGEVRKEFGSILFDVALHHSAMFIRREDPLAQNMKARLVNMKNSPIAQLLINYNEKVDF